MNITEILMILASKGYPAKEHDVVKNGVTCKGIMLKTGTNANPVFYLNDILCENDTEEKVANRIIAFYKSSPIPPIKPDVLKDRKWVLDHLTIALQRTSDEDLVKKGTNFDGIEQYLLLIDKNDDGAFSIKVTAPLLKNIGITESDAWDVADIHLINSFEIKSLGSVLGDAIFDTFPGEDRVGLHVVTTKNKIKGAAAILWHGALKEFANKYDTDKLVIIPSSVHEMLIIPYDGTQEINEFSALVKEVNASQVPPEEQLADQAYLITV